MKRYAVSKGRSVRQFRSKLDRTKAINVRGPMRGGIRL